MERAAGIDEFIREPIGRYVVGATHVVWCHSASLCGAVNWGFPSEKDVRQLVAAWQFSLDPRLSTGFSVIMDNRALEQVTWRTLSVVAEGVVAIAPRWHGLVRRQAIVIPPGIIGVLLAGLAPLAGIVYPLRLFQQHGDAVRWLDHPAAAAVAVEVQRLCDEAQGSSPLLRALRDHLDGALTVVSLASAARALALSPRSLQRDLGRARTSFRAELERARVRAASALLADGDDKVEAIARRVGCVSASQLSRIFRRQLGETPSEHRARLRRARTR